MPEKMPGGPIEQDPYKEEELAIPKGKPVKSKKNFDARDAGLERAIEILGKENVLGPKEVEKTFGVRVENIPEIPFSPEELERAREMNMMLVLRVDKTKDGKPMSLEAMNEIVADRWDTERKGRLLDTAEGWRDSVLGSEAYSTTSVSAGWALTTKDVLPNSTKKNYIEQTEIIVQSLRENVFKGMEIPKHFVDAIAEFESKKDYFAELMGRDPEKAAQELAELSITKLTRATIQDCIYDLALYYDTYGKRLLGNRYAWSGSLSWDGSLVDLGGFAGRGVGGCNRWGPDVCRDDVGVSLSLMS